jgi:predicted sugar kinase
MVIEIAAPCSLPLGLAAVESGGEAKTCLLGVTLQHPPGHLFAQAHEALKVTGSRADRAHAYAQRFRQHHGLQAGAEVEIELAIPAQMGLSSETMLGLSVARALAWLHDLPFDDVPALAQAVGLGPEHAVAIQGFSRGGLLFVDVEGQTVRRRAIAHDEREAWAFVFHLPRISDDAPETLEEDRLAALVNAASHWSAGPSRLLSSELWTALADDDLSGFGRALLAIQELTGQALEDAGAPWAASPEQQAVLDLMRENGALAWGRSATGRALFGLVRGAATSIELRKRLQAHVGIYGGTVMATITDNSGARHRIRDERLKDIVLY